jgi:hypothetical protein
MMAAPKDLKIPASWWDDVLERAATQLTDQKCETCSAAMTKTEVLTQHGKCEPCTRMLNKAD